MAKVESHISDAHHILGGIFFQPTVLTGVTRQMRVAGEETRGPVSPLFKFETVEEVIGQANDTLYGLASYFHANDLRRVWQVLDDAVLISDKLRSCGAAKRGFFPGLEHRSHKGLSNQAEVSHKPTVGESG